MLLMIEKHHRHPAKSIDARYQAKILVFIGSYHPATIGIVRCHPKK